MSKKPRRKFTEKSKKKAVEDYTSGKKSAVEVAHEMSVSVGLIYRWKADFEVNEGKSRVADLTASGMPRASALKMRQQEEEIAAYQKKVAEQAIMIDLLKKLPASPIYQCENEFSGLIAAIKKSDRRRGPVK